MTEADSVHSTPPLNSSSTKPTHIPLAGRAESVDSLTAQPATRQPEAAKRISESRKPTEGLSRRSMLGALAALPLPAAAIATPSADPIYAVISHHEELAVALDTAVCVSGRLKSDDENPEAVQATSDAEDALIEHADILVTSEPTTIGGLIALLQYVGSLEEWKQPNYEEWIETFLHNVAATLTEIQGGAA